MIHGSSPRFKAPWKPWRITGIGPAPAGDGSLDLRVGHCRGPASKTLAESMEALDRRRRAGDPLATGGDLRSSLVPVVLVDGRAVAAGWGRIRIPLPAGRHLVEVQSQHSRAWRAVDIQPGRTAELDYIGMLGDRHRQYANGPVGGALAGYTGYTLGPRGRLEFWQYLPPGARERRSFMAVLLVAAVSGPATWAAVSLGAPAATAILACAAMWLTTLAVWGVRVLWTWRRYNRCPPEPPLDTAAIAAEGRLAPHVLDPAGDAPEPSTGAAAVLIDARFVKADLESVHLAAQVSGLRLDRRGRRRLDAIGEITPIRHRVAVPPPKIELDGRLLAATWTRMWIEVPPGRHRLSVTTPRALLPVVHGQAPPETATVEIDLPEGRTTRIDLAVEVTAAQNPDEARLYEWRCRIERFEAAEAPPPRIAPRADVRGGLRRSATGRWWERLGE
ncbi:hypothetical protein GCM10027447_03810 [Glycomyces halotolerans]